MHKLQECRTLQEAEPFLRGATPTFRKTVETAIILRSHASPEQRALGDGFMATAIKEMDAAEEPASPHDKGIKAKGEKFVKEELLPGGDKNGNDGSEQSSSSKPTDEGTEEPVGDLTNPEMSTENQMKEGFGQPPMGQMPGMDPAIAAQMMPQGQMPQMTTPQQIQQMQYTVKKYMETYVLPIREQVNKLTKANHFLSNKIKEIQTNSMGIDVVALSRDSPRMNLQETLPTTVTNFGEQRGGPRIYEKAYKLESARQSIIDLDKMYSNNGSQPYQ